MKQNFYMQLLPEFTLEYYHIQNGILSTQHIHYAVYMIYIIFFVPKM